MCRRPCSVMDDTNKSLTLRSPSKSPNSSAYLWTKIITSGKLVRNIVRDVLMLHKSFSFLLFSYYLIKYYLLKYCTFNTQYFLVINILTGKKPKANIENEDNKINIYITMISDTFVKVHIYFHFCCNMS